MWKAVVSIAVILIALVAVAMMTSQDTLRYAIDETSAYAQRPQSATEIALTGQQLYADVNEPQSSPLTSFLLGIVVFMLVVGLPLFVLAYMRIRTDYMKQARLNKKASKKPRNSAPTVRWLPGNETPSAPQIGRASRIPQLEDGREDYQDYGY